MPTIVGAAASPLPGPWVTMQNVDFKCELRDPDLIRLALRRLDAAHVTTIEQTDTYYRVPDGRLKRRETAGEPTEYVFYHRLDRAAPTVSHFRIYSEQQALARFGHRPLPVWIVVRKVREIYFLDGIHLHVDKVDGLGWFFEADGLVRGGRTSETCEERIDRIREALAPGLGGAIATSYADMLADEQAGGRESA